MKCAAIAPPGDPGFFSAGHTARCWQPASKPAKTHFSNRSACSLAMRQRSVKTPYLLKQGACNARVQTVGNNVTMGQGTIAPLVTAIAGVVPELAIREPMLAGFGLIARAARRRRDISIADAGLAAPRSAAGWMLLKHPQPGPNTPGHKSARDPHFFV